MASQGFTTLGNASNIMSILGAIVILVNQSMKHFGRSPRLETAERILEECKQFLENLQSSDIARIQRTKPGFMGSMRQGLEAAQRNLRLLRVQAAAQPGLLNELNFWSDISNNITLLLQNLENLKAEIATTSPRSNYVSSSSGLLPIYNSEATSSRSRDLSGAANLPHTNLNAPPLSFPRQSQTVTETARHRPQLALPREGTSIYVPSQPQTHDRSNQQLPSTNTQMRSNSSGDYPEPIQQRTSLNPIGQIQGHSLAGNYSSNTNLGPSRSYHERQAPVSSHSSQSQDDGRGFHPLFAPPPTSDAGLRLHQERTTPGPSRSYHERQAPVSSHSSESQDDSRGFHPLFAPPPTSDASPRLYQERTTHSTQSQAHSGRHNTTYRSGNTQPQYQSTSDLRSVPVSVPVSGESTFTPRPHPTGLTSSSEFYINPQMYTSNHARGKNQSASQNVSSPQTHLSPQNVATSGLRRRSPSHESRPPLASNLNQASSHLQDIERGVANLGLHPQSNPAAPEANPSHSNRRTSSYISSTTMQPTAGNARPASQYDGNWNSNTSPRDNSNSSTGIPMLRRQTSASAGSRPPQPISRLSSDRTQGNYSNTYNRQPNPSTASLTSHAQTDYATTSSNWSTSSTPVSSINSPPSTSQYVSTPQHRAQQGSYSGDYNQSTPWPPRR